MFQSHQTDEVILRLRLNDLIFANKIKPFKKMRTTTKKITTFKRILNDRQTMMQLKS